MEVLITGSRGYVGGRLSEFLAERGFRIRAGSRTPGPDAAVPGNIVPVRMDYDSPDSLREATRGCEAVVHLASLNEIESSEDPEGATRVNTLYTQRMFRAAAETGVERFVYFSTVHVYGSPLAGDLREDLPVRPAHPYSISHYAAEEYLRYGAPKTEMGTTVFRLTNSFGYPVSRDVRRWTLVVNDAARQLASDGRVVLKTPGTQIRDFVALGNVCQAVLCILSGSSPSGICSIYNLGKGTSISILDMVGRVGRAYERITGRPWSLERPEPTGAEGPVFNVNLERLYRAGYVPAQEDEGELEELVRRCLRWFGKDSATG